MIDWLIRSLGGVPRWEHDESIAELNAREEDRAERLRRLDADYGTAILGLNEATAHAKRDAINGTSARILSDMEDARRLAEEASDRWECWYTTHRLSWRSHELTHARTTRLFVAPLGQTGAGFDRPLTIAETNVRECAPPPLALRAVSVRATLARDAGTVYEPEEATALEAMVRSLLRRHAVLRLDLLQTVHEIATLEAFDLDGGGLRPVSLPADTDALLAASPRSWAVVLDTGPLRLPRNVAFDLRVSLHGTPLPPPAAADPLPSLALYGLGSLPGYPPGDSEATLRRIVREEVANGVSGALSPKTPPGTGQ